MPLLLEKISDSLYTALICFDIIIIIIIVVVIITAIIIIIIIIITHHHHHHHHHHASSSSSSSSCIIIMHHHYLYKGSTHLNIAESIIENLGSRDGDGDCCQHTHVQ